MDNKSRGVDAVAFLLPGHRRSGYSSEFIDDDAKGLLHVFDLLVFVVAPFDMEAEHWNSIPIHDIRINLTVIGLLGDHLASPGKTNECTIEATVVFFELPAVSTSAPFPLIAVVAVDAGHKAEHGNSLTTAELNMIAARKIQLSIVQPPGHIKVHSPRSIFIVTGHIEHLWNKGPDICPCRIG